MRSLVINSGGESKRLKEFTDLTLGKAWLKVQGKPLLIQNIESLQSSVEEISIIVRDINQANRFEAELDKYNHLIETEKVQIVTEKQEITSPGPVRGIISGIQSSQNDIVWFMPCDHPFLTPEIFKKLESHLMEQGMVTLQHDTIGFEPQVFVSDLKTLRYFSNFVNELPVDLYRLVPNSLFLPVTDRDEYLALLGVNTSAQLKKLVNHSLKKENTIKTGNNKLKVMKRPNLPVAVLEKGQETPSASELYQQGHYYLLERLYELKHIPELSIPLEELILNEWRQWREISPLIAFHCGRRWIKMANKESKFFSEVEVFISTWLKNLEKNQLKSD